MPAPGSRVRWSSAVLKFGEAVREAVAVLEGRRQNDRDPQVREYAGRVLEKLWPAG
jgi:hypothetical protein